MQFFSVQFQCLFATCLPAEKYTIKYIQSAYIYFTMRCYTENGISTANCPNMQYFLQVTAKDRAKLLLTAYIAYNHTHVPYQLVPKCMTLNDL